MNNTKNKLGGLFTGLIFGLLMIIGSTILLWWNEGNNVKNIRTTDEVEKNVVEISGSTVSAEHNGSLVATNGRLTVVSGAVTDETFGVSAVTPVLSRVVEIYEWQENTESDSDGDTVYSYEAVWETYLISSSSFHRSGHDNPTTLPYNGSEFTADSVKVGAYSLSESQIAALPAGTELEVVPANIPAGFRMSGRYLTNSYDLSNPKIGDVRISWKYNDWQEASVLATLSGDSFTDYTSAEGKTVNYVGEGIKTSAEIVTEMRDQDRLTKWALRLLGVILMFMGHTLAISPLTKLVSFIPILGELVNRALVLVTLLTSLIQSFLIIAIAWIRFRPLTGALLLAACAGLGYLIYIFIKKKKADSAAQAAYQQYSEGDFT